MNTAAIQSLRDLAGSAAAGAPSSLRDAAREFEALLIGEMLRFAAKQPLGGLGLLDGGSAAQLAREQFFGEVARLVAARGGLGVAEQIEGRLQSSSGPAGAAERSGTRVE